MRFVSIHIQVNNNGAISFQTPVSQFTPDSFPLSGDLELIAPYWADVDTRGTGTVWYRETTEQVLLDRAESDIQAAFISQGNFVPTYLFIATWDRVGYFNRRTDLVSSQYNSLHGDYTNTYSILFIVLHLFDCLDQHIPVCDGN